MRRAISIVLAAVLVATPIKMVLAQAGQQESQVAATDSPSLVPPRTDQTPARIGVPVVEPNSGSALLFTVGLRDHTLARNALPVSPPYRPGIDYEESCPARNRPPRGTRGKSHTRVCWSGLRLRFDSRVRVYPCVTQVGRFPGFLTPKT